MGEPTVLLLPPDVAYPVTISTLLLADPSAPSTSTAPASPPVQRGTALFRYSVLTLSEDGQSKEWESRTFESPVAGQLQEWCVKAGQSIRDPSQPIVKILEPCLHIRQFHGMCTDCGAILTEVDYAGPTHVSRATVRMSHHDEELLVSQAEAERLERDTADRLLGARKLSLIVDLDQTVIHATVDPTVGEWMQQPSNPNFDALRGVGTFKLAKDGSAMSSKAAESEDGCSYFVKLRPGLKGFLETMSDLYEMHVYTMGTRSYAESVCRIIDADSKLFGGRILSRSETENEGLTSKSLSRLFPCDTSMVVVIDDRADVWEWSPNLVKVIPYDFFVGIGDINGSFLPKRSIIDATPPGETGEDVKPSSEQVSAPTNGAVDAHAPVNQVVHDQEAEATQAIEEQLTERPLLKAQEALHAVAVDKQQRAASVSSSEADSEVQEGQAQPELPNGDIPVVKNDEPVAGEEPVLKDDDRELERLRTLLKRIHLDFYDAQGRNKDVRLIIPVMKRNVLDGVGILFSGVIPLSTPPQKSEIWKLATQFGATCHDKLSSRVTHLVAAKSDTAKVNAARRRRDVAVVWAAWLFDSIAQWKRQDEGSYLIEPDKRENEQQRGTPQAGPSPAPKSPSEESDIDVDGAQEVRGIPVDLNWADADAELDAMLNETDESDAEGPLIAGNKRPRSRTASFEPDPAASPGGSPLLKRQRLTSSRSSRLKLSFNANGQEVEPSPRATPSPDLGGKHAATTDDSDEEDFAALAAQMS